MHSRSQCLERLIRSLALVLLVKPAEETAPRKVGESLQVVVSRRVCRIVEHVWLTVPSGVRPPPGRRQVEFRNA